MERLPKKMPSKVWLPTAGLALAALLLSGCALSPEAKEARFLDAGKKALAKKDYARALIQFKNAVQVKKNDDEPYYQLGLTYLGLGDTNTAIAAFWKAAELNPKRAEAQVKIAELMITTRDREWLQVAQTRLGNVLNASPDNADALNALAIAEWELGKPGEAEEHLLRTLRNFPNNLQASVNLAKMRMTEKNYAAAEEILKAAANQQPPAASAVTALAEFYFMTKRNDEAEQQFRRAIQLDPKNPLPLYDLGNLLAATGKADQAEAVYRQLTNMPERQYRPVHAIYLLKTGKTQAALAEFEKLSSQDPKDRGLRTLLVQAYWKANRPVDAEKLLGRVLKENPKDIEALTQRSAVYLGIGKYAESQDDLNQVLRLKPDSAEAHYLLSRIHRARSATLARRQELTEAVRLRPDILQARLELAQMLLAANAAKASLELMNSKDIPTEQQKTLPVIVQRNWALVALGDTAESRKGVDAGLALSRTPDLLLQDAVLKLRKRDISAARASIDEALAQSPGDLRGLDLLVLTYRFEHKPSAVAPKLRDLAAKHPDSVPVRTILGDWLLASGDKEQARVAFSEALELSPRHIPAVIGLAKVDAAEGKLDDARRVLASVPSSEPGSRRLQYLMGNVEDLAGNRAKALDLYLKFLDGEPDNAQALNNVAVLLADFSQKPDEALKYAQRAKELAPENPAIDDTLGWVLYRKGLYTAAIPHLRDASAKLSQAVPSYHLSMAYFKSGDPKLGSQTLAAALQRNSNVPEAKMARDVQAEALRSGK